MWLQFEQFDVLMGHFIVISGFSWRKCKDLHHSKCAPWFKVFWRNAVNFAICPESKADQEQGTRQKSILC